MYIFQFGGRCNINSSCFNIIINIWYLMRYGRKNSKEQILFLIRFFEEWCNVSDLVHMSKEMQQSFENKKCGFSSQATNNKNHASYESSHLQASENNLLKESTVTYITKANKPDLAVLYLEDSKFTLAIKTLNNWIEVLKSRDKMLLQRTILAFMSYKQYEGIYRIFKEFELKKGLLPMYYALMYFMQDKLPNEYLKTNPEIKETVDEIIEVVKKEQTRLFA